MKVLKVITKEKIVNSAKNLIKVLEVMQEETLDEITKEGYKLDKYSFLPTCEWKNINENCEKVLLTYKIEVFEK